jgi:two-component system chemotaxis response regulator CheY
MAKIIMTADDSASVRQMVSFTLKQGGYEVVEAVDGKDALQKLASHNKVDMLITDLNMPNLDGIGLIKGARALPGCKFIPIVMLTTESQDSRKQEGKAAGATGWIVKPFKPEQLMAVVKKVLG